PLLAKALSEKQPNSLKEVAALYADVLGRLREAMGLKPYVNRRGAGGRGLRFDIEATRVALADPAVESLRQQVFGEKSAVLPDIEKIRRSLGNQFTNPEAAIRAKIVTLQMAHPGSPARAMVLEDAPKARDSKVFIRGEPGNRGPIAPRQFLEVIAGENRKPFTEGSGRLELAQAIASRDNPLTARVMVNRVWQWHFGQAIVRTVSDFGVRSEPPTHPELLDYLASYFMDNGWSLKRLHRLIMLSGVYQQDSRLNQAAMQKDPTNQWIWRFNLQRLDFEQMRDSLLASAGKLDLAMGGPSVALADAQPTGGRYGYSGMAAAKPNPYRRTVYGMIDRSALPEVFNTFDFANPDMSTGERILTTVPQQALFLMNSRFIVQQVRNLLGRPEFENSATTEDKVRFLYRTLYQRPPDAEELKMAVAFVDSQPGEHSGPGPARARETAASSKEREGDSKRKQTGPGSRSEERVTELNTWERYAQVVMLANEMVFVN
ncbi:MAG: DUF1553 domain-containing protein, partial [Verrucomicrobiota bacterium]|nr:DUF1553 domain-containing protein [Verrucomicrobiota bacterium]